MRENAPIGQKIRYVVISKDLRYYWAPCTSADAHELGSPRAKPMPMDRHKGVPKK